MYSSRSVTQPAFSIAPMLYSGTNSWSYLPNGYAMSNASSKYAKPCLVSSNMSSASRCSRSDCADEDPQGIAPRGRV